MLRRKKMAKLVAREKKLQEQKEQAEKTEVSRTTLLQRYLAPEAQTHLSGLKKNEPHIGKISSYTWLYTETYVRQSLNWMSDISNVR